MTGDLWFTDNGRDKLGDDVPPDELNRVTRPARISAIRIAMAAPSPIRSSARRTRAASSCHRRRSWVRTWPRSACASTRERSSPPAYRNQVFIAEHGSWNRSQKIGYRVTLVRLDAAGKALSYEPFAEGWLDNRTEDVWGRPADVLVAPDGSLLVSDDYAGAIYRIRYRG